MNSHIDQPSGLDTAAASLLIARYITIGLGKDPIWWSTPLLTFLWILITKSLRINIMRLHMGLNLPYTFVGTNPLHGMNVSGDTPSVLKDPATAVGEVDFMLTTPASMTILSLITADAAPRTGHLGIGTDPDCHTDTDGLWRPWAAPQTPTLHNTETGIVLQTLPLVTNANGAHRYCTTRRP